ncbi:MAG TPA: cytochrome c [Kofleriaceae bacterium]|nr:cytochrome c [Kofleriaceae bacterium]
MMRLSILSILLSLGLACGGGSKDTETTPGDTTAGDTAGTETGTASGDTAGTETGTASGDTAGTETGGAAAGPSAADQVAQGEKVYGASCATCHGPAGEGKGKKSPPVVGAKALTKYKNAADLEKYIKEKMPKDDPGTLSDADSWAVTAWIVSKQGKLGDAALTAENAASITLQ